MAYVSLFGKSYGTYDEFNFRLARFIEAHEEIIEHNESASSFTMGHNKFSDWTEKEMAQVMGYKKLGVRGEHATLEESRVAPVDWRALGAVTKVKDQG